MTKKTTPSPTLHQAAKDGDLATCKLLIERGAKVDAKDRRGRTPLHYAVMFKNSNIHLVRLLLKNGANPNAIPGVGKKRIGYTALHSAVLYENTRLVRLLLDYGATFRTRDHDGMTVIDWAYFLQFKTMYTFFGEEPKSIRVPKFLWETEGVKRINGSKKRIRAF
jgi:ankyrin repeat protein